MAIKNSSPKVSRFTSSMNKEKKGVRALGSRNSTAIWKLTTTLIQAPTDLELWLEKTGNYARSNVRTSKRFVLISFANQDLNLLRLDLFNKNI